MAQSLNALAVGALVKDTGTLYNGKPIIWKIADKGHTGYPSGAVTLITERIISLKCFDAIESGNSDGNRRSYGNNRWTLSNVRHLLRAGVNMIYIRDFLGHVDISTTEVYARIDAEMKRKVFEEKVPNFTPNTTMPWEEDKDLLQWLTKFGKKSF